MMKMFLRVYGCVCVCVFNLLKVEILSVLYAQLVCLNALKPNMIFFKYIYISIYTYHMQITYDIMSFRL